MSLVLNDDQETLEAALALIDEWEVDWRARGALPPRNKAAVSSPASTSTTDSDDQGSSSSSSPLPTQTATAPTRKPRARKTRSDEDEEAPIPSAQMQRREELLFLRDKVRELEKQLTTIQTENNAPLPSDAPTTQLTQQRALDPSWVWQQIASRQLEHRQCSERENLRLRVMVEEQLKIAKDLMRVLLRAYHRCQDETKKVVQDEFFRQVKVPRGGLAVISEEDQLRRVMELYDEGNSIFAQAPFAGGPPVFRDINVLEHDNGETTINVDSSWVVPYPTNYVAASFWRYLAVKTGQNKCRFEECLNDEEDIIITRYESSAMANRLVGKFVGRFVGKRFPATDLAPQYLISDMRGEPVEFKPQSMEGVRIHNETIMRVVAVDANSSGHMSLLQTSTRVHVLFAASETPTRRRRVGALTDYMMLTVEAELKWKQQLLEDLLLEGSGSE